MTAPTISATPKKALDQRATSKHDNALVSLLLRLRRELGGVLSVHVDERLDRPVSLLLALGVERLKETAAYDLIGLVTGRRQPRRLYAAKHLLHASERLGPSIPSGLGVAFRQRTDGQNARDHLRGFGERLEK
jgi:hypothetical protein